MRRILLFALACALAGGLRDAAEPPPPADHAARMTAGLELFRQSVRPLLSQECFKCHGGEKTKGGLNLATREDLLKGGDDGPVVVPFRASESRLVRLIRHAEDPHMPGSGSKLPDEAVAKAVAWIENGAPYDTALTGGPGSTGRRATVTDEDRRWWAFRPLAGGAPPSSGPGGAHPIDRFIQAKAGGRSIAPPAERRVLIRRAFLDLTGLPPSPEEVEAFAADPDPGAWPRLVDRLLESPHYGERWARHWLDVARFAESSGFEHDYDREGAFHYRDFVIRALNQDLPFDQFVRWQLAGDEFEPDNPLALTATGFLGAGVFPTQITANEVERTRYDALDDMLSTTSSAFLGLTVGCARCHDHKYDPIPSEDYYRMLSSFTTTVRSVIDLDLDPAKTREMVREWERTQAALEAELGACEAGLRPKFADWLSAGAKLKAPPAWALLEITNAVSAAGAKFSKLDDGSYLAEGENGDQDTYTFTGLIGPRRVTGLRLEALAHPSMKGGGPGRADNGNIGLSRLRLYVRAPSGEQQEVRLGHAVADFEQNHESLSIASALDENPHSGWAVDPQFGRDHAAVFTLAEPLETAAGTALTVTLEFQLNTRHNIGRPRISLTDLPTPALGGEVLPGGVARVLNRAAEHGATVLSNGERTSLFDWWKRQDGGWAACTARLTEHRTQRPDGRSKVLVCAEGYPALRMHTQGADFFDQTYQLRRGNPDMKGEVARQSFLQVMMPAAAAAERWHFQPPSGARYSGRRRSLANWLTDADQGAGALVARVAVNRLWQHHFGRGIVATPNDFGKTGAAPSHPELLDWLAGELIRGGWRLKGIHRLMMTSRTYLESSAGKAGSGPDPATDDSFTRRLPRRLEGEAIRDSILAVSGALDPRMYGPGTKDEASRRRSIYFTIKRSELIGSMVAFDQPEPLASQGFRPTTTVAPQALMLLNAPQVRQWAETFRRRIAAAETTTMPSPALIASAYRLALGRPPTAPESDQARDFLTRQATSYRAEGRDDASAEALTDFCQVLFGLNEFAYEY